MAYELQSLDRALAILDYLTSHRRSNLTEIAAALEVNTSTCLRTLRVLERHGLVRRDGERGYRASYRLIEWGEGAVLAVDARREVHASLERLAERLRCTVHLGVLRDGYVTVIDKMTFGDSVVHYSLVGSRMPLHCSAMGKAILGLLGPDSFDRLGVRPPLAAYTDSSITSLAALGAEVEDIRARGFSVDREEFEPGFVCAGIALRDRRETYAVSATAARDGAEAVDARGKALLDWLAQLRASGFPITGALS